MRCQEEEKEEEGGGDHACTGTGYEGGQYISTALFCDIKQRRNCSLLTSSSIAITS